MLDWSYNYQDNNIIMSASYTKTITDLNKLYLKRRYTFICSRKSNKTTTTKNRQLDWSKMYNHWFVSCIKSWILMGFSPSTVLIFERINQTVREGSQYTWLTDQRFFPQSWIIFLGQWNHKKSFSDVDFSVVYMPCAKRFCLGIREEDTRSVSMLAQFAVSCFFHRWFKRGRAVGLNKVYIHENMDNQNHCRAVLC